MPTERFNHLPEEKKNAIREAALEEFIRVPFEKASINKIIQNAGISRGSFYTYFEDKRDVLGYIFSDVTEKLKGVWKGLIQENQGNIWKATEQLLSHTMIHAKKGRTFQMMQHIALFQDFERLFVDTNEKCEKENHYEIIILTALYDATDKSDFKNMDMDYFGKLMSMILMVFIESMGRYYQHPEDIENIKKIFCEKLEILQYGICKR